MLPPVRPDPSRSAVNVAVCICTCNRPAALEKLLNTLCLAQWSVPGVDQVELIIVDNLPDGRARAVYERCRGRLPVPIYFAEEKQRGISFARNRAVAEAFARGAQFVAFIDDDDIPQPDWLARLVERQRETKADIVTGVWRPPRELRVPPHLSELKAFTEGDFDRLTRYGLPNCGTCNVLIARSAIELSSVADGPFRAKFALTGGGDTDFFIRAHRAGATIVQAKESVVLRCPDGDRATLAGALRYAFRLGCSRMRLAAEHFPADRYRKMRAQSVKKIIKSVARLSIFSLAKTVAAVFQITICFGELYASYGGMYGYYHRPS